MTREIVTAGKLPDGEVLDHLVFGHQARRGRAENAVADSHVAPAAR